MEPIIDTSARIPLFVKKPKGPATLHGQEARSAAEAIDLGLSLEEIVAFVRARSRERP